MTRAVMTIAAITLGASILGGCSSEPAPVSNDASIAEPSSQAVEPVLEGKWDVSRKGQAYMVPVNEYGDVVGSSVRSKNELDQCRDIPTTNLYRTSKVVPQLVQGRFVLFSYEDGPGRLADSHAPVDYSPSPFGAALAAYNAFSIFMGWGEYFHQVADDVIDMGEPVPDVLPEFEEAGRIPHLPIAFRLENCSPHSAKVYLLLDPGQGEGIVGVMAFRMVYDNNTWIWKFDPFNDEPGKQYLRDDIDWGEWTSWQLG
ncbi:MAG: hypothetical protein SOW59_08475 [Corynebacterium sp.]|nr:hypothetical protein [Corynebacterium sp.]